MARLRNQILTLSKISEQSDKSPPEVPPTPPYKKTHRSYSTEEIKQPRHKYLNKLNDHPKDYAKQLMTTIIPKRLTRHRPPSTLHLIIPELKTL